VWLLALPLPATPPVFPLTTWLLTATTIPPVMCPPVEVSAADPVQAPAPTVVLIITPPATQLLVPLAVRLPPFTVPCFRLFPVPPNGLTTPQLLLLAPAVVVAAALPWHPPAVTCCPLLLPAALFPAPMLLPPVMPLALLPIPASLPGQLPPLIISAPVPVPVLPVSLLTAPVLRAPVVLLAHMPLTLLATLWLSHSSSCAAVHPAIRPPPP